MSSQEVAGSSKLVLGQIISALQSDTWGKVDQVLGYYPIKNEVDVTGLITVIPGIRFGLPVTYGVGPNMKIVGFRHWQGEVSLLAQSSWGGFEPKDGEWLPIDSTTLILVPALAVDIWGNRLGYGLGCYDRLLSSIKTNSAAVAVSVQLLDDPLPITNKDQPVEWIVTPTALLKARPK